MMKRNTWEQQLLLSIYSMESLLVFFFFPLSYRTNKKLHLPINKHVKVYPRLDWLSTVQLTTTTKSIGCGTIGTSLLKDVHHSTERCKHSPRLCESSFFFGKGALAPRSNLNEEKVRCKERATCDYMMVFFLSSLIFRREAFTFTSSSFYILRRDPVRRA